VSTTPTVTGQPVARAVTVTVTDLTCGFNNSNDLRHLLLISQATFLIYFSRISRHVS